MSIGIILPSRGRPDGLKRSLVSLNNNTASTKLKVYVYLDSNDSELETYKNTLDEFVNIVDLTIGPPIGVPRSFNLLASKVNEKYIMMFNDDLIINTFSWDTIFMEKVDNIFDEIFVAFFNDHININRHAAFPIISKKWFDSVGYSSNKLIFQHNDTWIFSLGVMLNRVIFFEDLHLQHNHGYVKREYLDKTFKLNRNKIKIFFDHLIFLFLLPKRLNSFYKLKSQKQIKFNNLVCYEKINSFDVEINNFKETIISFIKIFMK